MKDKTLESKNQYDLISISSLFYPATGGLEIMVYNLLSYLTTKGHRPLAVHGRANESTVYTLNGFTVKTFHTKNLFDNTYPVFSFKFLWYMYKLIKSNPNAAILIHSRHFLSSFFSALACLLSGRKYFLVEHTAQTSFLKSNWAQKLVYIYERFFSKFVLNRAYKIISSSHASQNYLLKQHDIPEDKITVIYNGFDTRELNQFKNFKKKKKILFATKMIKVKNPEVTYKAFKDLAGKYPDWDFHFIGTGDFFKAKSTKDQNFKVVNKIIKREKFLKLAGSSTIYVNSSLSEGLSLAIVEATYLKNIPVISDAPSNMEIAERLGTKEYIFNKHDVEDLRNKLELAIKEFGNDVFLTKIGDKTNENFNNDDLFKEYERLLFP